MHYKVHIFTDKPPDSYKIDDILRPYYAGDEGAKKDYPPEVKFLWDKYEVGGRYSVWNGAVRKIDNVKRLKPEDCWILLDDKKHCLTRDSFYSTPIINNSEFTDFACAFANEYENGYMTVVDISI